MLSRFRYTRPFSKNIYLNYSHSRVRRARQKANCENLIVKNQQIDPSVISHPHLVPSNRNSGQEFGSPQSQSVVDTEEPPRLTPQNGSNLPPNQIPTSNSLDFLRPIGAGRGFIPFTNYPFPLNTKTVDLLDCSMLYHPSQA